MDPAREAILRRMAKLSQMTRANGCSEAEAAKAAEVLARLVAEHNISASEAAWRPSELRPDQRTYVDSGYFNMCCAAAAKLFSTKIYQQLCEEDILGLGFPTWVRKVHVFGFPLDVEATLTLVDLCYYAVATEAEAWRKRQKFRSRANIDSFRQGMCERLAERIIELLPIMQEASGRALVPLKDAVVTEGYAALLRAREVQLHNLRSSAPINLAAAAAGRSAAEGVALGQAKPFPAARHQLTAGASQ